MPGTKPPRPNFYPGQPPPEPSILAYQLMRRLLRNKHRKVVEDILADVGTTPEGVDEAMERLYEKFVDDLEECGCCGCYHRPTFVGECRDDDERFP